MILVGPKWFAVNFSVYGVYNMGIIVEENSAEMMMQARVDCMLVIMHVSKTYVILYLLIKLFTVYHLIYFLPLLS